MDIRLSLGSAAQLGLCSLQMDTSPTTLYAMLGDRCSGACTFCTQARDNTADRSYLSRVIWPTYAIDEVITHLDENANVHRICVQTLRDPGMMEQLLQVVARLTENHQQPISVCMNPVDPELLISLKHAGVERVGVGVDCATPETFSRIKPGFSWKQYQTFIAETIQVFGRGSVHLIVGLGDSDEDLVRAFQYYTDLGCSIGLFALTPMRGTKLQLPAPSIERYRTMQYARYLIGTKQSHIHAMTFHNGKLETIQVSQNKLGRANLTDTAFRTSGCPDCNRPNYNERPGGVMYNYAHPLSDTQLTQAWDELT
ncbi:MAG: radical SAM protein, partial [Anaerolineae bacterium]|nr:radical SAM protein [Anaerolineae bacterium]